MKLYEQLIAHRGSVFEHNLSGQEEKKEKVYIKVEIIKKQKLDE